MPVVSDMATSCSMVKAQAMAASMLLSDPTSLRLEAQSAGPKPSKAVYVPKASKAPLLSEHKGSASLRARPSVANPAELPAPPVPTGGNGDQSASIGWTRSDSKTTNRIANRRGALVWLRRIAGCRCLGVDAWSAPRPNYAGLHPRQTDSCGALPCLDRDPGGDRPTCVRLRCRPLVLQVCARVQKCSRPLC